MGVGETSPVKDAPKPQPPADDAVGQREAKQFDETLNQAKDASNKQEPSVNLESNNAWTYTDENGQIYNYVDVSGEDKVPTGRQREVVVGHERKMVGVRIYPGPIPVPVVKDEPVVVRRPEIETKPWHAEGWVKDRGEVIEVKGTAPKKEKSTFENITDFVGGAVKLGVEWGLGGRYVQGAYRGYRFYQDYKSSGVGEAAKNLGLDVLIDKTVGGIVNAPHGATSTHSPHGGTPPTPTHSPHGGTAPTPNNSPHGGTPPSHSSHGASPTSPPSPHSGTPPTSKPRTAGDVVSSGNGPLIPGKTHLGQYGIDGYGTYSNRPGDKFAGHEMLQNAWLESKGYGERLKSEASRRNPAVALSHAEHVAVGREQRKLGLFDQQKLSKMSAKEVIEQNALAMKNAGIPDYVIETLKKEALKHAESLPPKP